MGEDLPAEYLSVQRGCMFATVVVYRPPWQMPSAYKAASPIATCFVSRRTVLALSSGDDWGAFISMADPRVGPKRINSANMLPIWSFDKESS